MLKNLYIENIAVIEKSDIEFNPGLTVLTGETGAGKSIIIDSLNAVLGERTSKELIRSGCEKAEVRAFFENISDNTVKILNENGFDTDNKELLITRILKSNNSGTVRINGKIAAVGILKNIAEELVNIHGQHDNKNLLDERQHLNYIDMLAENAELLKEYYAEFKRLNAIRRELSELECDEDEKQRRTELLQFQISELEAACIKPGEAAELKEKLQKIESFESTFKALNNINSVLKGNDSEDGVITALTDAKREFINIKDTAFSEDTEKLSNIIFELDGISDNISKYLNDNGLQLDSADEIRERLDFLYRIMLKYGDSEEKILKFLEECRTELNAVNFSEKRINELSAQLDESTDKLIRNADAITASRKKAAEAFEAKVCSGLKELNMPKVRFKVEFKKGRYNKNGCDEVSFLISANEGEEPRPLSKIASGGELSRIMLAIKQTLAEKDSINTLIFDEIDTGISGDAALKVGKMLKKVSVNRQVICITHLAQIAAAADNQLLIQKHSAAGRTFTEVTELNKEQRINEIARIMAGGELTENIIKSAKELLDRS